MQLDRCRNSIGSRRTSNTQGRLSGQSVIVQFNMVWYLLVFILLSHVDSTTDHNQFCGGIPFVNLSPLNSDLNSNFRPDYKEDRVVYALFPESRAPECAAFPFSPLVACSTRDSDQTSSDILSLTLSIGKGVTRNTFRTDHTDTRPVQVLCSEVQAPEPVSFPFSSGNSIISNQPDGQITTKFVLPLVASSTGNRDRSFSEIPAIDVLPGNSVNCDTLGSSDTEERAVHVLYPHSLAPGTDSFQFFSEDQIQSHHQECPSSANPLSQIFACSTGNSDHSSNCIPSVKLSPAKKLCDTGHLDNTADLSGQYQVPESQAPGTALFALSTGGIPSKEPVGQVSSSQRSQTYNGSTPNSGQSYKVSPNMICFVKNDIGSEDVLPVSKKRKIEELQSNHSDRRLSPLAFAVNWPRRQFSRPHAVFRKVSEAPLSVLEVFFNIRSNTQTQNRIAALYAVVIAIDNFLQESIGRVQVSVNVMGPQTRQISEHIMGHVDKNLMSCLGFVSLSLKQQQMLVNCAPMSFEFEYSSSVVGILATMSIVFRSTKSCGYHYPTLKLFWNASVKLLELHGANGQDFIYCLKLHIMERCAYASGATRSKRLWNRDESVGNCLHIHLSLVLQSIANRLVIAAMTLPEANRR
uniref:Uncharacterized protein n=1 Tax=Spongospora subterranea TaxID=70186 RepID=A0A0H5REC2_9EUKA|eukprot:CRZ06919.1 hypothetical protein [Spongospora subterranea]